MAAGPVRRQAGIGVLALLAAAGAAQVLRGVRYPEYDAQGVLKYEITGDQARVAPDGRIEVENLKLTFYEQGKVMMDVTTPRCTVDRVQRTAVSTAEVRVVRREVELSGRGFSWSDADGRLLIHTNARVVLRHAGGAAAIGGMP